MLQIDDIILCILKLQFNEWNLKFPRFVFDTKNLIGYTIAVIYEYTQTVLSFFIATNMVSFTIEAYLLILSTIEELKRNLMEVNKFSTKTHGKRLKRFGDAVSLHSQLIKLKMVSINLRNPH